MADSRPLPWPHWRAGLLPMPPGNRAVLTHLRRAWRGLPVMVLGLVLGLGLWGTLAGPAWGQVAERDYRCEGDRLAARYDNGPVDDPLVGNISAGTVPGAFVVLRWREVSLQLPRSNDAGPPRYTDGKWFWGLEDPLHPTFLLNRGEQQAFRCEALTNG